MSYYFIVQIKIHDQEEYQKYLDQVEGIFSKYSGKYLAVDSNPVCLEGSCDYTRIVLISFKSKPDFEAWYNSDEYQQILKYRLSAADCDGVLVKGL